MVLTISSSANAGLFGLFESNTCCAPAECSEPTCCAPAECSEPTCCAPAAACCEPTCCAPAPCAAPTCCAPAPAPCCEPACGEGCCQPRKKCGLFSGLKFKMPKFRLPKLFNKSHGC